MGSHEESVPGDECSYTVLWSQLGRFFAMIDNLVLEPKSESTT